MAPKTDKPHAFWQIPTGTVLGAVIMAIVTGLLGPKAPWFVERLTTGSREQVTLTVNSVFSASASDLDPKRWYVDQELGFALTKPPRDWLIDKKNPSAPLAGPSIGTIPFYRHSFKLLSPLGLGAKIQRDDIVTTEIRATAVPHRLEFTDTSSIDAVPLTFNPAASADYVRRAIAMQGLEGLFAADNGAVSDSPEDSESQEDFETFRSSVQAELEPVIKSNWPGPLEYSDNVTVTRFRASLFRGDPLYEAVLQGRGLTLYTAYSLVSIANPELMSLNTKSFSVSANNRAMLIDSSVDLKNFTLDGHVHKAAELRRFILLALEKDSIFVVVSRNLVGLGATGAKADKMREVFESFKLLQSQDS